MRRGIVIVGVVLALGALLLAGCEDSGYGVGYNATPTPPPAFSSPLDATAQAIALERYATRSAVELDAAAAQMNATVQAVIAQATADAARAALDQQRQAATEQAAQATAQAEATRQAWAMEATTQAWQATATAEALNRQATATAEARYWEATQQAAQATAQAEATAGALAFQATATSQARAMAATATAESYRATQAAYQATATRQAQQREEVLAYGRDYGIPAVLLAGVVGLVVLIAAGVRWYMKRPIVYQRDFRGDAQPLALPVEGGGYTFVDLDRQPGPAITVLLSGAVSAPQLRSPGQEERTTARDQLADLTTRPRLGAGQKGSGGTPALPLAPPPTPPAPGLRSVRMFRRLDQAGQVGVVPIPLLASLAADWETEPEEGV